MIAKPESKILLAGYKDDSLLVLRATEGRYQLEWDRIEGRASAWFDSEAAARSCYEVWAESTNHPYKDSNK